MKKKPKRFSVEFKKDTVRLMKQEGYTLKEASANLGISLSSLQRWREIYQEQVPISQLSESEELKLLRKENRRLKMEREILKKAAAFFAQENH
jgi:transposase